MVKNDAIVFEHRIGADWRQPYLLISDPHFDSYECDRQKLKKLLNKAKEKKARVLIFGDLFDAMGAKHDPRTSKADIRPEYMGRNYFDLIIKDAVKFFKPYKDVIKFISAGNHEESVLDRHETSLIERFIYRLGGGIDEGDYTGFIRFKFEGESGGGRQSKVMYYTHGSGGSSPVTMGVIKTNRRQVSIEADIYVSAHLHVSWNVTKARARLNEQNKIVVTAQEHIQLASFKNLGRWEKKKEFGAAPLGGYWLEFYQTINKNQRQIEMDIMSAK